MTPAIVRFMPHEHCIRGRGTAHQVAWLGVVALAATSVNAAESGLPVEMVLESSRANLLLLHSIECEQEFELSGVPGPWPRKMRIAASGDNFRYEALDIPVGQNEAATTDQLTTFNGVEFATLRSSEKRLARTRRDDNRIKRSPYPTVLWMPLWWLFDPREVPTWQATKDPRRWTQALSKVRESGVQSVDGRTHFIVSIEGLNGYTWDVEFAEELGFIPLVSRQVTPSGSVESETRITQWQDVVSDGQRLIVPTEVVVSSGADRGADYIRRCRVIPETLKINRPIEDSVFTIASASATEIYDLDTGNLTDIATNAQIKLDSAGNPADIPLLEQPRSGRSGSQLYWLVAVNLGVIITIVVGWAIQRRRKRTS